MADRLVSKYEASSAVCPSLGDDKVCSSKRTSFCGAEREGILFSLVGESSVCVGGFVCVGVGVGKDE